MKKFEAPELEVVKFDVMDVIATSNIEVPTEPIVDTDMGAWH